MSRFRHEYKYLVDSSQESILTIRASGIMEKDSHVTEEGSYLIRSLYFDDYDDTCMHENEMGTDLRSKFRIRYYNGGEAGIRLEKKSKTHGMTLKEVCLISEIECKELMNGAAPHITSDMPDLKKKLFMEMRLKELMPKVIVTYERRPFVYTGGNVRITFDKNITSSSDTDRFLSCNYAERPVLPMGRSILEIKWDEVMPLHIKKVMNLDTLQWTSFSKYYICRRCHL